MYNELKRQANNVWIEYVYGHITADKAIKLLEELRVEMDKMRDMLQGVSDNVEKIELLERLVL